MKNDCDNVLPGATCVDPDCPYCNSAEELWYDDHSATFEAAIIGIILTVTAFCLAVWIAAQLVALTV